MNLPRLNWLNRLIYPARLKYREKAYALQEFDDVLGVMYDTHLVREAKKERQRGKDQQSLEAAKIGDIANKTYQGRLNYGLVDTRLELQQIRHDGERQRWESSMNVLKCHIAHLEEIVTRQGEELKRLRR